MKSSVVIDDGTARVRTLLILLGFGVLVVLLHNAFRFPLNLPGRHGLDAMALFAMGRLISNERWAAGVVGTSAGGTALLVGAGAWAGLLYPICGVIVDLACRWLPNWRRSLFVLPVIAGLAWASRPVVRGLLAEGSGLTFDSLRHGFLWPVFTHLLFGMVGAFVAVLGWRAWQERARRH
ncbi:MAG: hypothetical protein RQ729_09710 [Wenzhouxiangellaceae bacterium]|nr:hypothetical protein [Wenzhouxiangellaceae bacterium]